MMETKDLERPKLEDNGGRGYLKFCKKIEDGINGSPLEDKKRTSAFDYKRQESLIS